MYLSLANPNHKKRKREWNGREEKGKGKEKGRENKKVKEKEMKLEKGRVRVRDDNEVSFFGYSPCLTPNGTGLKFKNNGVKYCLVHPAWPFKII